MASPFEITVKLDTEADVKAVEFMEGAIRGMASELKGASVETKKYTDASDAAARKQRELAGVTKLLTNEKLGLQRAAGLVATNLTQFGPAGQIASNALLAVATGAGAAGAAIGIATTAVAALVQRFTEAQEKKQQFDAAMRSGDVAFFTEEIALADQQMLRLSNHIDDVQGRLAASRAAGVRGDAFLEALLAGKKGELSTTETDRDKLIGEQQKILGNRAQQTTLALEFQTRAIGANIREQQELDHQLRVINALQGGLKDATQQAKDAFISQSAALRDARIGEAIKEQNEQHQRQLDAATRAQEAAIKSARASIVSQIEAQGLQNTALREGENAAALHRVEILANSEAVQKLGREGEHLIDTLRALTVENIGLKQVEQQRAEIAKSLAIAGAELDRQHEEELSYLAQKNQLLQQTNNFEVQKLRASGAPEAVVLQKQLEVLRAQKEVFLSAPKEPGQLLALENQITTTEIQLLRLQNTSIDVLGEVGRALTDITGAVITGTLRWADIGRSALASFARFTIEQFISVLRTQQQIVQSNAILGASSTTFALAGPGQGFSQVPFLSAANSGGGVGNIFGLLSNLFTASTTLGGNFPGGISLGGLSTAGASGFLLSQLFGLNTGGQIGSTVGSIGGSLVGATAFGTGISSSIASSLSSTLGATLAGSLAGMVIPVVGAIIGAIIGQIIGNQKPNPTAVVGAQFSGVGFNPLDSVFEAGSISVALRRHSDLSRGKAESVAQDVQTMLSEMIVPWVGLLNTLPDFVAEDILPALDETNARLNQNFARLKFSEGGSRNIQEELAALRGPMGQASFLQAFLPSLASGINTTLQRSGIDLSSVIFSPRGFSGLGSPIDEEGFDKLAQAIQTLTQTAGGLAGVPGLGGLITPTDIRTLSDAFGAALSVQDPNAFVPAVEALAQRIQPVTDFLTSALAQSTDVFGRGLIAAMEAATESDARLAFMQTLGTGIKDVVFHGLTSAFIASAQFNDLLAPIQNQIRLFTQQAIETGQAPDIAAFRSAILPGVESILSRADLLTDLIAALHEVGFGLRDRLGLLPPPPEVEPEPAPPPVPQNLIINLYGVSSVDRSSIPELARDINSLLEPLLAPRV